MANDLRELRLRLQLPAKEMVAVVRKLYPKYDKTLQSKCEKQEYGVFLMPDAMTALYRKFAPERLEAAKPRRKDAHRLGCRISCRLENDVYSELQQAYRADGYATMQELVAALVRNYLYLRKNEDQKGRC